MNKSKTLIGRWKIEYMEMWNSDYINLVQPGYFLFVDPELQQLGLSEFVFGTVKGFLDTEFEDEDRSVSFSWQGESDTDDACGRGSFKLVDSETAEGKLYIHCSDSSSVVLKRCTNANKNNCGKMAKTSGRR